MPVTVLLADDAEVVRKAIRSLLVSSRELIDLVGEAVDFRQTLFMANDLRPQVIVMDLHIARATEALAVKGHLSRWKMLAMSLSNDDEAKDLAKSYGAVSLLDKMYLYDELVPAIINAARASDQAPVG